MVVFTFERVTTDGPFTTKVHFAGPVHGKLSWTSIVVLKIPLVVVIFKVLDVLHFTVTDFTREKLLTVNTGLTVEVRFG